GQTAFGEHEAQIKSPKLIVPEGHTCGRFSRTSEPAVSGRKGSKEMRLRIRSEGGRQSSSRGNGALRRVGFAGVAVALAGVTAVGCGSSSTSSRSSSSGGSNKIPAGLSVSSFTVDLASTMSKLKPLTQFATKGANTLQVGVILPDTT